MLPTHIIRLKRPAMNLNHVCCGNPTHSMYFQFSNQEKISWLYAFAVDFLFVLASNVLFRSKYYTEQFITDPNLNTRKIFFWIFSHWITFVRKHNFHLIFQYNITLNTRWMCEFVARVHGHHVKRHTIYSIIRCVDFLLNGSFNFIMHSSNIHLNRRTWNLWMHCVCEWIYLYDWDVSWSNSDAILIYSLKLIDMKRKIINAWSLITATFEWYFGIIVSMCDDLAGDTHISCVLRY